MDIENRLWLQEVEVRSREVKGVKGVANFIISNYKNISQRYNVQHVNCK